RSVLNMYDISFSMRTLDDGLTQLSFETKHHAVMETAFEKVIERATNPETAADFGKLLSQPPVKKSFEERLKDATKQSEALQELQKEAVAASKVTQKVEEVTK
ncbi:hypothetical protein, partial [Streptococcus suis]